MVGVASVLLHDSVSDGWFCCLLRYRQSEVLLQSPTYCAVIGNLTAFQTSVNISLGYKCLFLWQVVVSIATSSVSSLSCAGSI